MLLGCIADDFTGASDLGNVLARGGMHTIQFNGVPKDEAACDAAIISLKSRSIPAADAVEQSLAALAWLRRQGCRQFLFKYCSTFDSTKAGNIGPVAEALLMALGTDAAIVCPAYPTLKRSIYRGHLFVGDALLNESGLEHHPLNPMTDANLARWLGQQTAMKVGRVTFDIVEQGEAAIHDALARGIANGERLIVTDCIADRNLVSLGAAVADMVLVTGGSGIAVGLAQNFQRRGQLTAESTMVSAPATPALALAGSCSTATREQIEVHGRTNPSMRIDADGVISGRTTPAVALAWIASVRGAGLPLVYSSADPADVRAAQQRHGAERSAAALEQFFGELARRSVDGGVRRLIVAGGETSSAVVGALSVTAMQIGPEIDPGVPLLVTDGEPKLALVLKSGNFGAPDFFARARTMLDGAAS